MKCKMAMKEHGNIMRNWRIEGVCLDNCSILSVVYINSTFVFDISCGFPDYSMDPSSDHLYILHLPLAKPTHAAAIIASSCTVVITYKFKRTCTRERSVFLDYRTHDA
jgi:hypothetical protein